MMVKFSTSSRFICGCCDSSNDEDVGHVDGCEVAASSDCASDGVCGPDPVVDAGLEGALEERVWLSRVRRKEVIMTWGTWYVLWSTWIAAASDSRSVMGVSESSLYLCKHLAVPGAM